MHGKSWNDSQGEHWRPSRAAGSRHCTRRSHSDKPRQRSHRTKDDKYRPSSEASRPLVEHITFDWYKGENEKPRPLAEPITKANDIRSSISPGNSLKRKRDEKDEIKQGHYEQTPRTKKPKGEMRPETSKEENTMAAATQTPQEKTFNFLGLPREIRDMVYEYIVGKHRNGSELIFRAHEVREDWVRRGDDRVAIYCLLLLNRQIHDEAFYILYRRNRFCVRLQLNHYYDEFTHRKGLPTGVGFDVTQMVYYCIGFLRRNVLGTPEL